MYLYRYIYIYLYVYICIYNYIPAVATQSYRAGPPRAARAPQEYIRIQISSTVTFI